jgi:hypothetical protein
MEIHRDELVEDLELAVYGEQPYKIAPLRQAHEPTSN